MKSKRSKATDIRPKVKEAVWERDNHHCIICGNPQAMPNSHYIRRSRGGLGIEENVGTMCAKCHYIYDNGYGEEREYIANKFRDYLVNIYPDWKEENLVYSKWV